MKKASESRRSEPPAAGANPGEGFSAHVSDRKLNVSSVPADGSQRHSLRERLMAHGDTRVMAQNLVVASNRPRLTTNLSLLITAATRDDQHGLCDPSRDNRT